MTAHNLATVFAPTLIGPTDSASTALPDMTSDIYLIEMLISYCDEIFVDERSRKWYNQKNYSSIMYMLLWYLLFVVVIQQLLFSKRSCDCDLIICYVWYLYVTCKWCARFVYFFVYFLFALSSHLFNGLCNFFEIIQLN